jgi:hypothetical protein
MRVLVVGTKPNRVDPAVAALEAAGHTALRCHDPDAGPFPCRGLGDPRACPLEGVPIDVAVTVRDERWTQPSPYEDGVVCALRRRIPLVVAGAPGPQPFDRWSSRRVEPGADLAAACEEAARSPLAEHGAVARDAAAAVLAVAGRAGSVEATVGRREGALQVEVVLPVGDAAMTETVAARVIGALRDFDPFATAIDVAVTEVPPDEAPDGGAP